MVYKFLPQPAFRNDVLACLTEVGSLDIGTIYESLTGEIGAAYDSHFEALFTKVATAITVGVGGTPPAIGGNIGGMSLLFELTRTSMCARPLSGSQ